jgi:hypothetical protein
MQKFAAQNLHFEGEEEIITPAVKSQKSNKFSDFSVNLNCIKLET